MKATGAREKNVFAQQGSSDVVNGTTNGQNECPISLGLSTTTLHRIVEMPLKYLLENLAWKR